jgi:hypothetical protein
MDGRRKNEKTKARKRGAFCAVLLHYRQKRGD